MSSPRARLFSALVPPAEVVASVRAELARHPRPPGTQDLRWAEADQWHVTLGFYGEDDLSARVAWMRERLTGVRAPAVRLSGSGTFPQVLWLHAEGEGLAELAGSVRPESEVREFVGHLTLARGEHRGALTAWRRLLARYASAEWLARDVVLMRSAAGRYHVESHLALL